MKILVIRKVPGLRKEKSYDVASEDDNHWKVVDHQRKLILVPKTHAVILIAKDETLALKFWSEEGITALKDTFSKGYIVQYTKDCDCSEEWTQVEKGHQFNPNYLYCSTGEATEEARPATKKYLEKRILEVNNQLKTLKEQLNATN